MKALLNSLKRAWKATIGRPAVATVPSGGRCWDEKTARSVESAAGWAEAYESLLLKAMGDRSLVERLVGYETRRCAGISRAEAIDRANRRWERDMNR